MVEDSKKRRRGTRALTDEEAALWSRVAATAEPLDEARRRPLRKQDQTAKSLARQPAERPTPARPVREQPKRQNDSAPALASFARREARKLGVGRARIDARLDLHGMRQQEAYSALKIFLHRAQAEGHRYVLIITGKGGSLDDEPPENFFDERDRGVLKRSVPQWLSEPAFRNLVVSYRSAHHQHGGEGALYVRLRRANRPQR